MGDMLDPETDMLGDVAGELVENWGCEELVGRGVLYGKGRCDIVVIFSLMDSL